MTEASPRRRDRLRRRHSLASGQRIVTRALPFLVERVGDRTIPDASLSPLERAVRAWRDEILEDLGGDTVSAAKRAVLDAAVGSKIILSSLDNFLYQLANTGQGLVNRRARFAYRIVNDRMRVADSFTRQLQTLGLDRVERPPIDLTQYLARRQGAPDPSPLDPSPHQEGDRDAHREDPDPDPHRSDDGRE
jgi:hypothetical protein